MSHSLGIMHFLAQSDAVGKAIIVILLLLSAASWYVIILKTVQNVLEALASRRAIKRLDAAGTPAALARLLAGDCPDDPYSRLAFDSIDATDHHRRHGTPQMPDTGAGELLTRAMRMRAQCENARRERGLTLLAATASSAPFIGLFGTVWGIYQALVSIGMSGQGTLDKVAGPVGEALIMTAAGLAVAIPAVLAYNFLVRTNRNKAAELAVFSHQLFTMLATGARPEPPACTGIVPARDTTSVASEAA